MKAFCCFLLSIWMMGTFSLQAVLPAFGGKAYRGASVSYILADAESGKVLKSLHPERLLSSASLVKLATTATALEVLGPEHRFDTYLLYDGKVLGDVLDGDIWILPLGDPTLASPLFYERPFDFLDEWTAAVRTAGIREVKGSVRLLSVWADRQAVSPYWLWVDLGNYYAAGVYSVAIYDNTIDLHLRSSRVGEPVELVSFFPEVPGLRFEMNVRAANNQKDSAYVYGVPHQYQRSVYGTIPAGRKDFPVKADNPVPDYYLRWLWQEHLLAAGIVLSQPLTMEEGVSHDVSGLSFPCLEKNDVASDLQAVMLHRHRSPCLAEVIKVCNFKSSNLLAEYLARHAAWRLGDSLPLSADASLRAMHDFWRSKGLDGEGWCLLDACGLAPQTAFSAELLQGILCYMWQQSSYRDAFMASIPLAGKEGTVRSLALPLEGELRLKSGSMSGVRCYAGYYTLPAASLDNAVSSGVAGGAVAEPATYTLILMINRAQADSRRLLSDIKAFLQEELGKLK